MFPVDDAVSSADLEPDPTLSTTQVGELFEVHPSTVKRWCERGALNFHRTDGGHRRIRLSEALRRGRGGATAGQLAGFGREAGSVWLAAQRAIRSGDFDPGRNLARAWLGEGAFSRIRDLVLFLGRNHPDMLPGLLDGVAREVMRDVGHWWGEGSLSVGEEHLVTESLVEALFQLRREVARLPAPPGHPVALVGCAEGEGHAMGSHCLRLILEQRGWEVRFLGADVPIDSWSALQQAYGCRLLCISFSSLRTRGDVVRTVERLAQAYDPETPYALALGGGMLSSDADDAGGLSADEPIRLPDDSPFRAVGVFPDTTEFVVWASEGEWLRT